MKQLPRFLPSKEVATLLGVTDVTLRRWRTDNTGPKYYKLGEGHNGRIVYAENEVLEWLEGRAHGPAD